MILIEVLKQVFKHIRLIMLTIGAILVLGSFAIIYSYIFTPRLGTAAVLVQLKSLNRWETASYTIEKVIDKGTNQNTFTQILFGDRILLIAHGDIIAGFDLSNITANSVSVSGKSITIMLPPPQILVTRLDNKLTYVYDRQQGLLVPNDKNLESEARLSAENDIRATACIDGILQKASSNAKSQLTNILKGIGFANILIQVPQGNC